jgi:hypothetical protein
VLEHFCEVETNSFPFFEAFPSERTPKVAKVAIPVNDTSEFRELFEATLYYTNSHSNIFIGHNRQKEVPSYAYKLGFNRALFVTTWIEPAVITFVKSLMFTNRTRRRQKQTTLESTDASVYTAVYKFAEYLSIPIIF